MNYSDYIKKTLEYDYQIDSVIAFIIIGCIFLFALSVFCCIIGVRLKNRKDKTLISILIIVMLCCSVYGTISSVKMLFEKRALQLDMQTTEMDLVEGIVEDEWTYKRGRTAVKIDGKEYRILVQTSNVYGSIFEGKEYKIWVLKNSGYVCKYQLKDDIRFTTDERILENDYYKFSESFSKIPLGDYAYIDSIFSEYVTNYYQTEPQMMSRFTKEGWMIHKYYREDYNAYVGYFQSLKNEQSYIYLMIDVETGIPLYFEENWY